MWDDETMRATELFLDFSEICVQYSKQCCAGQEAEEVKKGKILNVERLAILKYGRKRAIEL